MCGFVVLVQPPGTPALDPIPLLNRITHRGPDGAGADRYELPWATVQVAQRRLSIVDRAELPLPFHYDYLGLTLAYVGEVYNHRELRRYHLDNGHAWHSDCDTEVVARAWRYWGPAASERLHGCFSFVVVDHLLGEVTAVRDRAGVKPLLYVEHEGGLAFASEIKALPVTLIPDVDHPELAAFEADFGPRTAVVGVMRVPPGGRLGPLRSLDVPPVSAWWTLPARSVPAHPITECHVESVLCEAIRSRLEADIPVGIMVSGGLDSAIVARVAKSLDLDIPGYCVTFDEPGFDNLSDAREAAPWLDITPVRFDYDEMMAELPAIAWHLDTPATWTAACQWFLARAAAADGVKALVSGEGADEVFWGYTRYRVLHWLERLRTDPALTHYQPLVQHVLGASDDDLLARLFARTGDGWIPSHGGQGLVERAARADFYSTMQVLLRMADRMCMAHGIENRAPFLDVTVLDLAAQLAPSQLIDDTLGTKAMLRRVALGLGVPRTIALQQHKRGMAIPWPHWRRDAGATRGAWDRSSFAAAMRHAWIEALKQRQTKPLGDSRAGTAPAEPEDPETSPAK